MRYLLLMLISVNAWALDVDYTQPNYGEPIEDTQYYEDDLKLHAGVGFGLSGLSSWNDKHKCGDTGTIVLAATPSVIKEALDSNGFSYKSIGAAAIGAIFGNVLGACIRW